jgi:multiple antibiotic resistance protein
MTRGEVRVFEHRLFTDFVTLFVVINPINLIPYFVLFTRHQPPKERQRTALRSVVIAAAILVVFIVLGQILLEALGIHLPSFSIAGGLVLLAISLRTILASEQGPEEEEKEQSSGHARDVAVFPLATPLIAGPGAILAVVLLTDNEQFGFVEQAQTTLVMLAILAITYVVLLAAGPIQRILGTTGADVVSRVLGLILAALSVEIVIEGIRASFSLA